MAENGSRDDYCLSGSPWPIKVKIHRPKLINFVLLVFGIWQIAIIALSRVTLPGLPLKTTFNYFEKEMTNPRFWWSRANFDGIHYLHIARFGYDSRQQAFFPAYPQLINKLTPLFGGKDLVAGIFISNLSLLVFLFLWYKLICCDYPEAVARRALILFLLFPTSFFLGMVYTESLFLALIMGGFYAARQKHWWLAGLLGALASYTWVVGVFLLPALLWEWYRQTKPHHWSKKLFSLIPLFLTPLGLLYYMQFLWEKYADPLLFFHIQPYFGAGGGGGKLILLYQVFWRYFKMALTTKVDPLYFTVWLEILVALGFLFLFLLAYKKKIRSSYLLFAAFAYLIPTFSGTFSSLPRYVLALFPCFMYLATVRSKVIYLLGIIFGLLLVTCTILFYQGYWIS